MSPCLFNFYAEYSIRNARLDEAQAGIKIAGRNINNLRYADDTTLMAESEELKSLLMKVKEEGEKAGLKCSIQKTKIMASDLITLWQIDGERMETVTEFFSWVPKSLCILPNRLRQIVQSSLHFLPQTSCSRNLSALVNNRLSHSSKKQSPL